MRTIQTPKEIKAISFGLMDPDEYREMSATKVITADTYDDDGFPIDMGLMDPRLGVIDPGLECKTCGQRAGSCNGHFGHIELAAPVVHVSFSKLIRRLLRTTCRSCSRLCLTDEEKSSIKDQYKRAKVLLNSTESVAKEVAKTARKHDHCTHPDCNAKQYDIQHEKPTTFYEVQDVLSNDYPELILTAMQPDPEDENSMGISPTELSEKTKIPIERINQILSGEFRPLKSNRRSIERALSSSDRKVSLTIKDANKLMPSEIRDWFEDIPGDDLELLGIDPKNSRPECMILTVLPVPPVTVRPSITLENGQRSEDDLTHKLVDIIRINQRFMENREAGAPQLIIEDLWELLQYHVTTFMDNEISGTPPARHRSGRPLKTLSQRLKGKEGRFRGSLSGKRVNFSARTVISPDPTLSLNEVGVPEQVALEMTQTMIVKESNFDLVGRYVRNGPSNHPGANYVTREDGRRLKVTEKNCQELAEKIEVGWTINRHLIDGDIVLFNRQPSLHRMSIMAHEVVVMPYKTFRLNTVVCPPYNADFDGDEMNLHALQNEEARAEARVLMRVQEQILSPRFGENIIGAIQDHITGTYLLTHENPGFNETQALDLLRTTSIDELPPADFIDENGVDKWRGRTIFSELLPQDLDLEFTSSVGDTVVIQSGQLIGGTIDETAIGAFGGVIVDTIFKKSGSTRARIFINEVSGLAMRAIMHFGFSIGIDDESIPPAAQDQIDQAILDAHQEVSNLVETYEQGDLETLPGRSPAETLELLIMQVMGGTRNTAGEIAEANFPDINPAVIMAQSGARGSLLNLTQMAGCVGQQAVRGERVNRGFEERTLSHFPRNDKSAAAHGFVANSYTRGLNPTEFFFHAMGGREGLVDTAVRTSKSGYLQRRLINALTELEVQYDGTVRDSNNRIIQFEFGEDGISPTLVSSSSEFSVNVSEIAQQVLNPEMDKIQSDGLRDKSYGPTRLSEHDESHKGDMQ
jgi:DNA-directed RNA polymerase subunit A'